MEHSFVIPAYGAATHVAELIESLRAQTLPGSAIVLTTSTPDQSLTAIAARFGLPLRINQQRVNIATDWNFALDAVETPLVTIAHQDDTYDPGYLAAMQRAISQNPRALLAFCDYREHTPAGPRARNINLRIKRALCERAFGARDVLDATHDKLRLLSLGNPICCPSVTFNRANLHEFHFPAQFKTNLDWMAWLQLARSDGAFVYVRENLVSKGVHGASETTATIANRAREIEDLQMLREFWPRPVARLLAELYKLGYRANRVRPHPG